MLMYLRNLQPVGPVPDLTESAEPREQAEYLRPEVGKYTKRIVDLIIGDPCASVPEILRRPGRGGEEVNWSRSSAGSVVHLFGGSRMFGRTCSRL